jgi:ATP-dependent DNA helicase RecQ
MLAVLKQAGLVRERRGARYQLAPQIFAGSLDSLAAAYDERRQRDQSKLEQMVIYAQTALCRTALLLEALGEPGLDRCGTCDNCRGTATRAEAVAQGAA